MTAKLTKDGLPALLANIHAMSRLRVLVGVPEPKAGRKDAADGINNARLAYIHTEGSELAGIPARPFLVPGVKAAEGANLVLLKAGAARGLQSPREAEMALERCGQYTVAQVKKIIADQTGFAPLAQSTLDARARKGFEGTKALIRTAQLLNSITYTVRPR